ncbi:MAG: hypothetical protein SXG53_14570 [Pseudomonadota bacterium]|nr:hypothetical protein [Pseudomonadota bacterium]
MSAYPRKLVGETWWEDDKTQLKFKSFVLTSMSFGFAIHSGGSLYEGTLWKVDEKSFRGEIKRDRSFSFSAHCRLDEGEGGCTLTGRWLEGAARDHEWHATLVDE